MTTKLFRTITIAIIITLCTNIFSVTVSVSSTVSSNSKQFASTSSSMSSSVSMMTNGGQRLIKSAHSELYKDKEGNNPWQVRAYEDAFEKKNNNPGKFVQLADTNVANEKLILGNKPTVKLIDDIIDDAFGDIIIGHNYASDNYGQYGEYLKERIGAQFQ